METTYFNGLRFSRNGKNCYFRNAVTHERLHRYVWKYYNGEIPEGYDIHHIDGDKGNNDISNLQMLSNHEHQILHGAKLTDAERQWRRDNINKNARPKAIEWHKSEKGNKWHSEHIKQQHQNGVFNRTLICTNCGKEYVGKIAKNGGNTFCSNNCKSQYRRKNHIDNTKLIHCVICGKEHYVHPKSGTKTCSRSCTNRYRSLLKKGLINESKTSDKDQKEITSV